LAIQAIEDRPHYVTKVTDMADHKKWSVQKCFHGRRAQFISKNVRITGKLWEGLLKHKLLKPLDLFLAVSDGLTPESLACEVGRLIKTDSNLQRLVARSGDAMALHHGLAKIPLSSQMAFKLTVAKEQQTSLYQHLLLTALIANYLAVRMRLSEKETLNVLSAALFHDLGELHTDPALLDPKHRITEAERRHIDVHPITGYLIVKEAAGLDASVAVAVLQHQEKLDGSGYRRPLRR
jgi:HD-GYP domain-containing protein (c-di-GMP phosphodiesterase class II)